MSSIYDPMQICTLMPYKELDIRPNVDMYINASWGAQHTNTWNKMHYCGNMQQWQTSHYLTASEGVLVKMHSAIWFGLSKRLLLHPCLLWSWSTVLIGWDCLWLGPSHYVCKQPWLCTANGKQTLKRTARGPNPWIWQKKCFGFRIADCNFNLE